MTRCAVALVCDEAMWARGHGSSHPLKPERLQRTYELLEAYGALSAPGSRGWLALGGGGYSLDVVLRAWTLAYGVMSGKEFPQDLPPAYSERSGPGQLHDAWCPTPPAKLREQIRTFARASIATLRRKAGDLWLFPLFT